ncbi:MAG TPA: N-acetylmuramic acid 6-phosphate etherase, partial [Gaiellaceae bacterium]|nr:N-acetylmuramic acid 6-phosphate etherase [Gaiellaceae bacterium]
MSIGCAYFGARVLRHVARDMEELAALGYTGVLHAFSENDLAYYRGTMTEIVEVSHRAGLEVQASPWGFGGTFGGEAESRFLLQRPDAWQVGADGTRVPAACLNHPAYRALLRTWAEAALEAGVDRVFWDEPHWAEELAATGGCHCDFCRASDGPEASLLDFLAELVSHAPGRCTVCLLPDEALADWDPVAGLPGLTTLATDPYWQVFREPAGPFVERYARKAVESAARNGVGAQLWVPAFRVTAADIPDIVAAVEAARGAGIDDLWVWGFEACGHMSALATPDSPAVWAAVTAALTAAPGGEQLPPTERHVAGREDLDLRPTRELVELMNDEDARVAPAVRRAAPALAAAIDAIAERLERGGRLVYVGAGSSGRLALVDALECGPTFGIPPEQVIAIGPNALAPGHESAEDDAAAGAADTVAAAVGPGDAVVAVSASGSTPYVLGAARAAVAAGALTVAVVCARDSELGAAVDHEIAVETGAEVIAGSTRLKAGTAQKLVLNTISTVSMIRAGRTFGGLMVGVVADNAKLRARARRALATASGATADEVEAAR